MPPTEGEPGGASPRPPQRRRSRKKVTPPRPGRPPRAAKAPPSAIHDAASAAARRVEAEQRRAEDQARLADELEEQRQEAEAAAWDDTPKASDPPARNGHNDWVDYSTENTSWDPWDEGGVDDAERGLNRTLGEWLEAVVPPEAQIHFFNAGREFAAGIQTTLDHHLNRDGEDDGGGAQAQRIEIE